MFNYNDVYKTMRRGERMISRRNAVFASEYQGRKYILKIFTDDTARQTEESNLLFLSSAGIRVPKTAASFPCSLLLGFIPGKDFVSLITEAENSLEAVSKIPVAAAELAQWFKGFHSITGLLKGDVNLRNFIFTEDEKCVGLDFEDKLKKGQPEKDAGTILAYALSYEPINVTHASYASNSATSSSSAFTRSSTTSAQSYTFKMSESASTFRNLGWLNILESMGTTSSPNYRISSVYGWRYLSGEWDEHYGLDIVSHSGVSSGKKVYSAFAGTVTYVYSNSNGSGGYGIIIEYTANKVKYYTRYLHLRDLPARANGTKLGKGNTVSKGEQVGFLGGTGGVDPHLHFDVHRGYDPTPGGSFVDTIDPRAFYADGFIRPWNDLNIQN